MSQKVGNFLLQFQAALEEQEGLWLDPEYVTGMFLWRWQWEAGEQRLCMDKRPTWWPHQSIVCSVGSVQCAQSREDFRSAEVSVLQLEAVH